MFSWYKFILLAVALSPLTLSLLAQEAPKEPAQDRTKPDGTVLLIGGRHQDLSEKLRARFVELAGADKARIVIIPTATADQETAEIEEILASWRALKPASVDLLHTRDPKVANAPSFSKPLREATGVLIFNGHRHRIFDAYEGTLVQQELQKLLRRGGVVAGCGTGAGAIGQRVTTRNNDEKSSIVGLGILPGFLIDGETDRSVFSSAIRENSTLIGLMMNADSAAEIHGNEIKSIGEKPLVVYNPHAAGAAPSEKPLPPGKSVIVIAKPQATP